MSAHTALKVGGPADVFVTIGDVTALKEALEFASEHGVSCIVIGSGSGMIVRDGGIGGMVLKLGAAFRTVGIVRQDEEFLYARAGAAVGVDEMARFARESGAVLDPAFIAGRGTMAGRFIKSPTDCAATVEEMTIVDRNGRELTIAQKAFINGQRPTLVRNAAVVALVLKLKRCASGDDGRSDEGPRCAEDGSNAVLHELFHDVGKQSAAAVIAEAGLAGVRVGRMRVGSEDANSLVNEGGAKARDAVVLINMIRDRVKQSAGVVLETAVRIVGEDER